ncbi:hypothetical protein D3C87_1359070 [compost metagenome]
MKSCGSCPDAAAQLRIQSFVCPDYPFGRDALRNARFGFRCFRENGGVAHRVSHAGGKLGGVARREKAFRPVPTDLFGDTGEIGAENRHTA